MGIGFSDSEEQFARPSAAKHMKKNLSPKLEHFFFTRGLIIKFRRHSLRYLKNYGGECSHAHAECQAEIPRGMQCAFPLDFLNAV